MPLGQSCHERLDTAQGRPAGFQQRAESEHGRGGPVLDDGLRRPGAGETAFHQDVEGVRDILYVPRRLARERGGLAVGPVDEEPVDGVLQRIQAEKREQGCLCRIRHGGESPDGARAVGAQCRPFLNEVRAGHLTPAADMRLDIGVSWSLPHRRPLSPPLAVVPSSPR